MIGTLSHCFITLICAFINPWLGLVAGGFYYGRELTQSEYRYISAHGGKRSECSVFCGLFPSAWTLKGFLDFFLPWCVAGIYFTLWKFDLVPTLAGAIDFFKAFL